MEKEKMGANPDTHHINTDRITFFRSRVAGSRPFNLHYILKVGHFFIPTVIFLVLLEALFRLLNLPPYPIHRAQNMYVQNDYSNFSLNKGFSGLMRNLEYINHIYVDDLGFRNFQTGKVTIDSQKKRILVLGDSMTFGQGVEYKDTFTGLLTKHVDYQVFNAGVPSYGTIHSLGLLQHVGSQIKPDIVFYFFYPGNDFYDNKMGFSKHVIGGHLMGNSNVKPATLAHEGEVDYPAYSEKVFLGTADKTLLKTSFLYKYLRYKASFIPSFREVFIKKGIISLATCALPYSPSPFSKTYTKESEYTNTMSVILDMKKFVEKDLKAKLVLVHIPVREQVDAKLLAYEKRLKCVKPNDFDDRNPNKYLQAFTKENKIGFIDTTENLQKFFDTGKNPFFVIDTHFNTQGHKAVYEVLNSKMKEILKK